MDAEWKNVEDEAPEPGVVFLALTESVISGRPEYGYAALVLNDEGDLHFADNDDGDEYGWSIDDGAFTYWRPLADAADVFARLTIAETTEEVLMKKT